MPRVISGQRVGRSFVSPTGAANAVSRVLDFQLAADQGVQLEAVLGYGVLHDDSPATSDTVPAVARAIQSLHLEEGTTEVLDFAAGDDDDELDTEVVWVQSFAEVFQVPATAGGGGGSLTVTPSGLVVFPDPIVSPRNITHKGYTFEADCDLEAGILFYYRYVQFTNAELGVLLSRR